MTTASPLFAASLIALSLAIAAAFLVAVRSVSPAHLGRSALGALLWMGGTAGLAATGVLSFETRPPTMLVLLVVMLTGAVVLVRSPLGGRLALELPLSLLVGYQGFRVLVEIWLHRGWVEGVFPVQMTYSGLNFDIVSGITALVVAVLVQQGVGGRRLVLAWNVLGLALLATIVTIALLSAPLPFRVFDEGPANVYVTGFPGVWLPAVLVAAALVGHLLVFRRLLPRGR